MKKLFTLIIFTSVFILSSCFEGKSLITPPAPVSQTVSTGMVNNSGETSVQDNTKTQSGANVSESGAITPDNGKEIGCLGDSFQSCREIYKDDKGVFTYGDGGGDIRLDMIDVKSVEPIFYPDDHSLMVYIKDKNNIWYSDYESIIKNIYGFNAFQFKMLTGTAHGISGDYELNRYITDGANIYYGHQKISSNPESFQIFNGTPYSKDKNNVFFNGFILTGAISNSFEIISNASDYAKDKNYVYFDADMISGANPSSFRVINEERIALNFEAYASDTQHIYCGSKICFPQADAQTLNLIEKGDPPFFKDKNSVYFGEEIIEGADPVSFKVFKNTTYSKDKNYIFYDGMIFNEVDPETFTVITTIVDGRTKYDIHDKNHIFDSSGKIK